MSEAPDYGPLQTFEITWMNGHVERIQGHQICWPVSAHGLFDGGPPRKTRVQIHADVDGRWTLLLSALEDDIRTIRNLATEGIAIEEDRP